MKIGPKYKIAKRLGASVFEKTQTQKFALAEERASRTKRGRRGGQTEYGKQLLEKQKVRMTYGLSERQFSNYVATATSTHGQDPAEVLHRLLEMRLDNVLYRLGLAPTRRAARQMASHGHITVNGVKTTIPSRAMKIGDRIAVREGSKSALLFENFAEKFMERPTLASWLSWNPKTMEGGLQELPTAEAASPAGDLVAVLSFYSR
ncbi:30S ribosomal protein S4 [Patescibacteria group bacterium]|nr:30S ribosomal protein S4 [Patescibacteria group bacterium]MBU1500919.1 30S ribosomal protein S4 [Patescibacteria group bacterium]MBU2080550.1 30S ribosomal protein S4 [Patescibacteria group bacterium]MBU2124374.1 30S ribosomal protein S4 [Patescibacteria group bacterium]MBU2194501.1 30S ribosomal protein S4 [Patescibacteria group bacterium]